jgi:hypothetical protein
VEITQPHGWFLNYTPPDGSVHIGNPVDSDADPCKGAGVTLAFMECRRPDVALDKVSLGTLRVTNVGGGATQLVVKRHISPANPQFRCPLLIECNEPRNDKHCIQPALRVACGGEDTWDAGPPGHDGAFFVTALNGPLDAQPYAPVQRYPERELIVRVADSLLALPQGNVSVALEAADVRSSQLRHAFEAARVAEIGAAYPDCGSTECAPGADVEWCASVADVAVLRFNHARTARTAMRSLQRVDAIQFIRPAESFVVPHETTFRLRTGLQDGMRIENDTRFTVTISKPAQLRIELLDVTGRAAATLQDAFVPAGEHEFTWAESAGPQPSGLYTLRARAGGQEMEYNVVIAGE